MTGTVTLPAVIQSGRLALRPPRPSDAGLISLYLGDARVARMLPAVPHPYPPGGAEALIAGALNGQRKGPLLVADASASDGPELIGLVFVKERAPGRFGIGFMVGPPFWNTGYGGEMVAAAVDALFDAGAESLSAVVFADDRVSARLLERAGFARAGEGAEFCAGRDGMAEAWRYEASREAWSAGRGGGVRP